MKDVLLKILFNTLWAIVQIFLKRLAESRFGDDSLVGLVFSSVKTVQAEHPDWTGDQKRQYVIQTAMNWAKGLGKDVDDSFFGSITNTALEMSVLKSKIG